jgi:DNA processing protein
MNADDRRWLVALADLPGMGPSRLGALLDLWPPAEAWERVLAGRTGLDGTGAPVDRWRTAARAIDVDARWAEHERSDVTVITSADASFPSVLADDQEPPAVLFVRGDLAALDRPRVAIVGTRQCTAAGRSVARELGHDLAAGGVCVVSGLALGIDGAAHAGALAAPAGSAPPAGVVGTGLDVVYPRRHADLWAAVAATGCLLTEYPLGTRPERWRFPARNRVLAALAHVVVVVESHIRGGSMHTVEAALERDRTVMAVPGPVRSPASAGTNALLAAGSPPVRDAADVLIALGLTGELPRRNAPRPPPPPGGPAGAVLDALGHEPATLDQLAVRTGLPLADVAVLVTALEGDGWLTRTGTWFERTGGPPP